MIPKTIVPANARIPQESRIDPQAVRQDLMVPRNLIPSATSSGEVAKLSWAKAAGEAEGMDARSSMVPKALVPAGARIGAQAAGPDARDRVLRVQPDVFDEALLGKSSLGHQRSAGDWLLSLAVHALALGALIAIPLLYTQVIDPHQFQMTYLAAQPIPGAPPPPPALAAAPRQAMRKMAPATAKLTMPIAVPRTVSAPSRVAEAPTEMIAGIPGGIPGGIGDGQLGGILGGLGSAPAAPPPAPVVSAPAAEPTPSGPLQVGGQVKRPRAIFKPAPEYPILAKQARIQGVVEVEAVIDTNGNVIQAHAMSGPQVLFSAALAAVRTWKYEPTYLNGQPYAVELTVQVTFSIS